MKSVVPKETHAALGQEALLLLARSQPFVPVKTGRLRAAGQVIEDFVRRAWTVFYDTLYALAVHEATEIPHVVGSAKYLEIPFQEMLPGMPRRVRDRIRRSRALEKAAR